jgi:ATP-dependent Clp protease ATP-binding subunit ClpC
VVFTQRGFDVQFVASPLLAAVLEEAEQSSAEQRLGFIGVEHLFAALVDRADSLPKTFVDTYLETLRSAAGDIARSAWGRPATASGERFHTPRCARSLHEATRIAGKMHQSSAQPGHLMLALLQDPLSAPSRALAAREVAREELVKALRTALRAEPAREGGQTGEQGQAPAPADDQHPVDVSRFVHDLTEAAREGKLEPVVGRTKELTELLQILARKNRNNALLVGEAGVGKTKLAEGLAILAAKGRLDHILPNARVLELDLGALMAGTQFRGAFEERLQALLEELRDSPGTLLFIDEVHLIMGAGATENSGMDAANLLKPALARGEIRCVGATTLEEYRKHIEKDAAMTRRFQLLRVAPMTKFATYEVLKRLRPSLEKHHQVTIRRRTLRAAIALTEQFMPNRYLPDKAIDVVDEACARRRLSGTGSSDTTENGYLPTVLPHDIRKVVSQRAAVPIEDVTARERAMLNNLEARLARRVVGQDDAVHAVASAVRRVRTGLNDPKRPASVMLFAGPTGVGKTQLAKELAEVLFGDPNHLVTFDMSEYTEAHSVSRLLGAPPGYVGYEEEGRLCRALKDAPFSILLFDEIEKAHPKLFDVLLPMLDEGRVRDASGREVSLRNAYVILTSNVGSEALYDTRAEASRKLLLNALRKRFRAEFINRIDEIVPFYPLLFEDIRSILVTLSKGLEERLATKKIRLHIYQGALEYLAEQGYSPEYGARELRRTFERLVVTSLSEKLIAGEIAPTDHVEVLMDEGVFTIRRAERGHEVALT